MKQILLMASLAIAIAGCGDNNDRLKELAQIQGEEGARKAVEAENANREKLVAEKEADLQRRLRFYSALTGKDSVALYKGKDPFGYDVTVKLTFKGSYYIPNRVRSIEEVEKQISELSLTVKVWFEDPSMAKAKFICEDLEVQPKLETGLIHFEPDSPECRLDFYISVDAELEEPEEATSSTNSKRMNNIFEGHIDRIQELSILEYTPELKRYSLQRKADEDVSH